jgi:hypothetical protein
VALVHAMHACAAHLGGEKAMTFDDILEQVITLCPTLPDGSSR